ncbi:hypothetical protein [Brumicola blandensis]|uniref:Antitoxin Xre/MbcA/ParS-like toxin-binding domain-containing protein n=1 Tax=Brumicola blandensis TaxID=3075611 RepID=A0AAW8QWX8_9ALTE|nr:hypothetical protein [Alteromonas sp. W409]MDT0581502.1 hypothetical protein [Alteromonas sp. W409]
MTIHNQTQALISELGISESHFRAATGLSPQPINGDEKGFEKERFDAILSLFAMLETWFDSPKDAWEWYTEQPLIGFGNLTSSEVVIQNQDKGAFAVIEYIKSKNIGSFE